MSANRRFRCTALPKNPGEYWDGHPEQHTCGVYWESKDSVKPTVASLKK